MGKRNGKKQDDIRVQPGELVETAETTAAATATVTPPAEPPSIEERVARLEALLSEKDRLILRQANTLAVAVENAERLRKSRERVKRLEDRADEAKKAASEAKKAYETAVSEHFDLERELDSPQQRLPFGAAIDEPDAKPDAQPEPEAPAGEAWRAVILDTLDLSNATAAKLYEANITTVGELSDYLKPTASGFCKRLNDIPGIGAAKAEEIENALETFWTCQVSPVSFPAADANAEILAGVEEAEAAREFEPLEEGEIDVEFEEDEE